MIWPGLKLISSNNVGDTSIESKYADMTSPLVGSRSTEKGASLTNDLSKPQPDLQPPKLRSPEDCSRNEIMFKSFQAAYQLISLRSAINCGAVREGIFHERSARAT